MRYQGHEMAKMEGKDHVDKIFQLKLSLPPPKEIEAISGYIRWLAASLPDELSKLIAEGCPPNLRKIKRILNLIYFLAKGTKEEAFDKDFPLIDLEYCYSSISRACKDHKYRSRLPNRNC
jgi:hypothetical protein